MIPKGIEPDHINLAVKEIDRRGVPVHRESVHYDLLYNGKKYPPKYVISLASQFASGDELAPEDFNAVEAKSFLQRRGYRIIDRRSENVVKVVKSLIPDENIREKCLKIFSECLIKADESGSTKWGVHVKKDRIRLLVGSLIVCTVIKDKIWMALDREMLESTGSVRDIIESSGYWTWDTEDYPEYSQVPTLNGYYEVIDESFYLWAELKKLHFELIRKTGEKYKNLQVKSQKHHEPALIAYIQDTYDLSLPLPEHGKFIDTENESEEIDKTNTEIDKLNIPETEKDALIKSRVGQGRFRTEQKIYWKNHCAVTGCTLIDLLKASHIKPWRDGSNEERLDKYNGLLLVPNLDNAFDKGYISFGNDGSILISEKLNEEQLNSLGIDGTLSLSRIEKQHHIYLDYHRKRIFKK